MTLQMISPGIRAAMGVFKKAFAEAKLAFFEALSGKIPKKTLIFKELKRKYRIYIPSFYSKFEKLPLVLVLHGRGGNGASMLLLTRKGFNQLAERDGFIVVYPDGIEMNWNDGRKDEKSNDRAHRDNIDDVGFISALIDIMEKDYNIDPQRVFVTGISNGAIMAYRLACELSHKITAIAPVDGNIPQTFFPECLPYMPVSVLAINNTDDPLVPFEGGEIHAGFNGVNLGKVLSVEESIGFWVRRNRCEGVPVVEEVPDKDPADGTTVVRKRYRSDVNGSEVILYEIRGGGHTWPGGIQYLPASIIGRTCRDFDANEVIWSFFRDTSRQVLRPV